MKTANLLISVAIASVMIANPAAIGTADAAKIKIKVDASHGHNTKIKPRIRIKPKITAAKAATKVKVKRKKKLAKKINPAPKPAEEAQITRVGGGKRNSKLATSSGQSRYVELPEITHVLPTFRIDFEAGEDAAEAARAAAELKDLIELGALRASATPDLGMATPDLARDIPSNADRLGDAGFERRTGGMFPGDDLGSGPGGFGTLSNSHNRKTPNNPWGVDVNGLGDGILSTGTTTTHTEGNTILTKTVHDDGMVTTGFDDGKMMESKSSNPGNNTVTIESWGHGNHRAEYHIYSYDNGVIQNAHHDYVDHDGNRTHHHADYGNGWSNWTRNGESFYRYRITQDPRDFRRHNETGSGINRMTDPDYVGGGSNCRDIGCIVNGEGGMKPLNGSKLTKAEVLPAGPDEDNGGISASGTPIYTSNDVLERYDEDSRRSGDAIRLSNLCMHSEC